MLARFLDNWPYKLLALAIAIVLRVYVGSTVNPQTSKKMTIPILIRGVPDSLIATDYTQNVTLDISGPPSVIDSLGPSDLAATVNVSKAHPGANPALPNLVTIAPDLKDQVSVNSKAPSGAAVYLDPKADLSMSVHAEFSRTAPVGYEYQLPTVNPPTARVDGPESLLKNVNRLVVSADMDSDSLANPTTVDDTDQIVAFDDRNLPVEGVTVTPTQAHVSIPLRKVGAFKSLVISPQITGSPKYPLRVSQVDVDPSMVVVSGPAPLLAQTSVVLTVPVDLSQQTDTFKQFVKLDLPAGLSVVQNPIVEVTVHLTASQPSAAVPSPALTSHKTTLDGMQ